MSSAKIVVGIHVLQVIEREENTVGSPVSDVTDFTAKVHGVEVEMGDVGLWGARYDRGDESITEAVSYIEGLRSDYGHGGDDE